MKIFKIYFLFLFLTNMVQAQPTPLEGHHSVQTPDNDGPVVDPGNGGMGSDRKVVWVHGLEGSESSWGIYESFFQSGRKMTSTVVKYSGFPNKNDNATSVNNAVNIIKPQLAQKGITQSPTTNTIFIAHSLGGLVTRDLDNQMLSNGQSSYYGGFVTFSTPHNGAIAAQSLHEGKVDVFLEDGAYRLMNGPSRVASYLLWISPEITGLFLPKIAEFVKNRLKKQFDFATGPSADLPPNSQLMNSLNGFPTNKPVVTVAAKEDNATLWREVSSLIDIDINLLPGLSIPISLAPSSLPMHTTKDHVVPNIVNGAIGVYGGLEDFFYYTKFLSGLGYWSMEKTQLAFHSGKMWLIGAPGQWNDLIGSNRTESETVLFSGPTLQAEQEWIGWKTSNCSGGTSASYGYGPCYSFTEYANRVLSPAQRAAAYGTYMRTYTTRIMNEENDGIVLKSSSHGLNGPLVTKTEISHVNHQECMNHEEVTKQLNEIFNGQSVLRFFKVDPR